MERSIRQGVDGALWPTVREEPKFTVQPWRKWMLPASTEVTLELAPPPVET